MINYLPRSYHSCVSTNKPTYEGTLNGRESKRGQATREGSHPTKSCEGLKQSTQVNVQSDMPPAKKTAVKARITNNNNNRLLLRSPHNTVIDD